MTLLVEVKDLASRAFRQKATGGNRRSISSVLTPITKEDKSFWGFLNSLVGGVWQALTAGISWSLTNVLGVIVGSIQAVYNFNWNITDKEINEQIHQAKLGLIASLGTTIGAAVAEIFCGAIPGALIMVFNEPLGLHVLEQLGEQALGEMIGHLTALMQATFKLIKAASFGFIYKNVRNAWRGSDASVRKRLKKNGVKQKDIDKVFAERDKPWSFASAIQGKIDNNEGEGRKVLIDSAYNQFGSTCLEAGYAIAGAVDSFYAQQASANDGTTIEVDFTNVDEPTAKVIKPDKPDNSNKKK